MQYTLNLALLLAATAFANPLEKNLGRAWHILREGNTALYHAYVSAGTFTADFAKRMASPAPDSAYDAQLAAYSVSMGAWQNAAKAFVESGVPMPTGTVANNPPPAPAADPAVNQLPAAITAPAAAAPPLAQSPPAALAPAVSPAAASPLAAASSSSDSPFIAPPAGFSSPSGIPLVDVATTQPPAAVPPPASTKTPAPTPASAPAIPSEFVLPDKSINLFAGVKVPPAASIQATSTPAPVPSLPIPTGINLFAGLAVTISPPTTPAPAPPPTATAAEGPEPTYNCGPNNELCPPVQLYALIDGTSVQVFVTGVPFAVAGAPGYMIPAKFLPAPDEKLYGRTMVGRSTFEANVAGLTFPRWVGLTPEGEEPKATDTVRP